MLTLKQVSSSNHKKLRTWSVVYVHACYAMLWASLVKTNKFISYVYMHAKLILNMYMHAMPCYELHCLLSYSNKDYHACILSLQDTNTCLVCSMSNETSGPDEICELSLSSAPPAMHCVEEREFWPLTDYNIPDSSSVNEFINIPHFHSLGSSSINLDLTI